MSTIQELVLVCVQVAAWVFVGWVFLAREREIGRLRSGWQKCLDENVRMADAILGIGEEDVKRDGEAINRGLASIAGRIVIRGWMDSYQTAIDDGARPPGSKRARRHWLKSHFLTVYRDSVKFWAATDVPEQNRGNEQENEKTELDVVSDTIDEKTPVVIEDADGNRKTMLIEGQETLTVPDGWKPIAVGLSTGGHIEMRGGVIEMHPKVGIGTKATDAQKT